MNTRQKPELLAPAGNLDTLKIALMYGADAVYCGTPNFAMRARVGFTLNDLKEGIEYAHKLGRKVYVTLNAFPHSTEIEGMLLHTKELIDLKPDSLIIADPGILRYVKENFDIEVHLSTQANTTNELAANFWADQGVSRIVLAREMSLKDISKIHQNSKIELESFVHGAMCMAYSGRCQISNYMTDRDPNQGQCIQACRFKYKMYALEEELRKDELFPIYEDEDGTHILNSKDLCMIEHIDELIEAGISSFKIEGRLKSEYYVASVVRAYREAIDMSFENNDQYQKDKSKFAAEMNKTANRGFTTGFYFDKPNKTTNNYETSKAKSDWGYIGRVTEYDEKSKTLKFICKNYMPLNSELEIITPDQIFSYKLDHMIVNGEEKEVAHADNVIEIPFEHNIPTDSFVRIKL